MRRTIRGLLVVLAAVSGLAPVMANPVAVAANVPDGVIAAALPTCDSWTRFRIAGTSRHVAIPSVGLATGSTNCILRNGNFNNVGVFVLQDALRKCYGQNIGWDGDYGDDTERAVANVQRFHRANGSPGLTVDGIYGPDTRNAMTFPKTNADGSVFLGCWI